MSSDTQESFILRPGHVNERNFIFSTWLKGLYYGNSAYTMIPKNIYMENMRGLLGLFLNKPHVTVKVACLKSDPDVILGYSVSHKFNDYDILDWIFVKSDFRKIGIGKKLVPENTKGYTHVTKTALGIIKEKYSSLVYNPFIFY